MAKNFGCDATGVTLAKEQAKFGTERIAQNGVSCVQQGICILPHVLHQIPADKARILNCDYRDIPKVSGSFDKISCLEMAEVRLMQLSFRRVLNESSIARWYPPLLSVLVRSLQSAFR